MAALRWEAGDPAGDGRPRATVSRASIAAGRAGGSHAPVSEGSRPPRRSWHPWTTELYRALRVEPAGGPRGSWRGLPPLRRSPFRWRARPGELAGRAVRWRVEAAGRHEPGGGRSGRPRHPRESRRRWWLSHVSFELAGPAASCRYARRRRQRLTLSRPPGTAARLRVRGGAPQRASSTAGASAHSAVTPTGPAPTATNPISTRSRSPAVPER